MQPSVLVNILIHALLALKRSFALATHFGKQTVSVRPSRTAVGWRARNIGFTGFSQLPAVWELPQGLPM
jgi:hypothetical protein